MLNSGRFFVSRLAFPNPIHSTPLQSHPPHRTAPQRAEQGARERSRSASRQPIRHRHCHRHPTSVCRLCFLVTTPQANRIRYDRLEQLLFCVRVLALLRSTSHTRQFRLVHRPPAGGPPPSQPARLPAHHHLPAHEQAQQTRPHASLRATVSPVRSYPDASLGPSALSFPFWLLLCLHQACRRRPGLCCHPTSNYTFLLPEPVVVHWLFGAHCYSSCFCQALQISLLPHPVSSLVQRPLLESLAFFPFSSRAARLLACLLHRQAPVSSSHHQPLHQKREGLCFITLPNNSSDPTIA